MARKKKDPHRHTIIVPVEIVFTTDPDELDDWEDKYAPTKESLVEYLKEALVLDVDNEENGQPDGACFAAAGVHWDKATLTKG